MKKLIALSLPIAAIHKHRKNNRNNDLYQPRLPQTLDDYGSGVTALSDLSICPMDMVKIDRAVLLAAESHKGKTIFKSLVKMAKNLGVDVVCEGIETEAQAQLARACGCRYGQGFRYFKPVSTDDLFDMIEKSPIAEDRV